MVLLYMSDCENPRFTERTSTNLGRSHRLPHVCKIMIYGKLGGYRLQETAAYIYICDELWIICDIWVSLMWILEKYDGITLKRGIANLEGPIAYLVFLTISINFHKPMSVEYIFSIAGVFTVAHMVTWTPSIYPSHVSIYTSTMDPMGSYLTCVNLFKSIVNPHFLDPWAV